MSLIKTEFGTQVTGRAWHIGVETVSVIAANCLSWRQKDLVLQHPLYSQKLFKNKPFCLGNMFCQPEEWAALPPVQI